MLNTLISFFKMGGYGVYIWPAYLSTAFILILQWWLPWKKWRQYIKNQNRLKKAQETHESNS